MELVQNFVNGQHVPSDSSEFIDIYEPATGEIYGQLKDSNANDICLLYTSPSPRDGLLSRMPSSA